MYYQHITHRFRTRPWKTPPSPVKRNDLCSKYNTILGALEGFIRLTYCYDRINQKMAKCSITGRGRRSEARIAGMNG